MKVVVRTIEDTEKEPSAMRVAISKTVTYLFVAAAIFQFVYSFISTLHL